MDKKPIYLIILLSLFILLISIIFNKSFTTLIKVILFHILIIIGFIVLYYFKQYLAEDKIRKKKELKEKQRQEEERKKKEEYERILQERKKHIEELKQEGLTKINIQEKINTRNIPTSVNSFQNDKIMVTFFGGKLIIYSIDLVKYSFNELLYIKEFSHNTYSTIEMKENKNVICVCGYPGIKLIEVSINNLNGKENNSYKVIQYFDCSEYNKEILKVIELNNESLISISTDYLLFWNKNSTKNNEYEINKNKDINYAKYENLLQITNVLKIDEDNIAILKQSNSNLTKSSVDFIEVKNAKSNDQPENVKIIDLKITPLDSNNNNLCLINDDIKMFAVGCANGLGILSGKNKELLQFIEFENTIKNIDVYFDNSLILFIKFGNKKDVGECTYDFEQLVNNNKNNISNDYHSKGVIKKTSNKFDEDINCMKCFNDGLIIIGDKSGNLQLWH